MNIELNYSDLIIGEITKKDLGKPLLYVDKFDNQIGILVGYDEKYVHVKFGGNKEAIMLKPSNLKIISRK